MEIAEVIAIAGPTGTGKTEVSVALAELLGAVVVSADAMQVYRRMDIGTAKATEVEQRGVLHFGLDVCNPDEAFDAAAFVALLDDVRLAHPRVVIVGGTSLYHRAAVRGLVATPPADPVLRARLAALDDPHAALVAVDPVLAARLHPQDRVRILRGLEVHTQTGVPLSTLQRDHAAAPDRIRTLGVWLDWPDVQAHDARLDARVDAMVARGYVDEVRALLDAGYGPELKPMQSLGYRHLCEHLVLDLPLDEAVRRTQRDTRRFARKQRTWQRALQYAPEHAGGAGRVVERIAALAEALRWR